MGLLAIIGDSRYESPLHGNGRAQKAIRSAILLKLQNWQNFLYEIGYCQFNWLQLLSEWDFYNFLPYWRDLLHNEMPEFTAGKSFTIHLWENIIKMTSIHLLKFWQIIFEPNCDWSFPQFPPHIPFLPRSKGEDDGCDTSSRWSNRKTISTASSYPHRIDSRTVFLIHPLISITSTFYLQP